MSDEGVGHESDRAGLHGDRDRTRFDRDRRRVGRRQGPSLWNVSLVVNAPGNSSVHVPDLPLLTGTFSGINDLSPAILHGIPLGSIHGTFIIDGDPQQVPFTGTFRLPFALDAAGKVKEPNDEREDTFYLGDDGQLIRVQPFERVLGFPPVRLELKF